MIQVSFKRDFDHAMIMYVGGMLIFSKTLTS